jgi:hypothetical protein
MVAVALGEAGPVLGRVLPAAGTVGMRQQLLMLSLYTSDEAASLAREAWLGLAGAAHHHA